MKLKVVRVQNYRSIRDSGEFDIDELKTILVGPNEAGKSVLLRAIQQINAPPDIGGFVPLRDYPRALYNDITTGKVDPASTPVVTATFVLSPDDIMLIDSSLAGSQYRVTRYLDNQCGDSLVNATPVPTLSDVESKLKALATHADRRSPPVDGATPVNPSDSLTQALGGLVATSRLTAEACAPIHKWLSTVRELVDPNDYVQTHRLLELEEACQIEEKQAQALNILRGRRPIFVLFNNYFRVHPLIHLEHLAIRIEQNTLDYARYDYGNSCLLKLLGFSARDLSNLGKPPEPNQNDPRTFEAYRAQLDTRSYQLNAASIRLTEEIRRVWNPDKAKEEADRLQIHADGQYLRVVVEDDLGVEVELDQRSEGFQWLVSFFIVFFSETAGKHANAILLLDEPGLSLHALKQREFRETISRLGTTNQILYTTHSPFLVGPDELDNVRVVELTERNVGTKVRTSVTSNDPAALLPLQEALGYDLAQSLFAQQRTLVLAGLTDYWYVEACAALLADASGPNLNDQIALVPASSAGKIAYFATILHARGLKVAALLDSEATGDQAAKQDTLVATLGNTRILRTKDYYKGPVTKPEIEDLLGNTLLWLAKAELGWDGAADAAAHPTMPLAGVLQRAGGPEFSKYKLAKTFLRWTRNHTAADLDEVERQQWGALITAINGVLG
jgi:AAA domain, putative AbiEii toxin, Type IV TA system/AAA ATPase domain